MNNLILRARRERKRKGKVNIISTKLRKIRCMFLIRDRLIEKGCFTASLYPSPTEEKLELINKFTAILQVLLITFIRFFFIKIIFLSHNDLHRFKCKGNQCVTNRTTTILVNYKKRKKEMKSYFSQGFNK